MSEVKARKEDLNADVCGRILPKDVNVCIEIKNPLLQQRQDLIGQEYVNFRIEANYVDINRVAKEKCKALRIFESASSAEKASLDIMNEIEKFENRIEPLADNAFGSATSFIEGYFYPTSGSIFCHAKIESKLFNTDGISNSKIKIFIKNAANDSEISSTPVLIVPSTEMKNYHAVVGNVLNAHLPYKERFPNTYAAICAMLDRLRIIFDIIYKDILSVDYLPLDPQLRRELNILCEAVLNPAGQNQDISNFTLQFILNSGAVFSALSIIAEDDAKDGNRLLYNCKSIPWSNLIVAPVSNPKA